MTDIVPDHTRATIISFWRINDGRPLVTRSPVIAWAIDYDGDGDGGHDTTVVPVTVGGIANVYCVEFKNHDGSPGWFFEDDGRMFYSFEEAMSHGESARVAAGR